MRFLFYIFFLTSCLQVRSQSCKFIPYTYFTSVIEIENNKVVLSNDSFPEKIEISSSSNLQIPEWIHKDSLIGLVLKNMDIDANQIAQFVIFNHIKHLELISCRLDSYEQLFSNSQLINNLEFLSIDRGIDLKVNADHFDYQPISIKITNTVIDNPGLLKFIFNCKVVVLDSIKTSDWNMIQEYILNGLTTCMEIRHCDLSKLSKSNLLNKNLYSLAFSNCRLKVLPFFIQNLENVVQLDIWHCSVKFGHEIFPNIHSLTIRDNGLIKTNKKKLEKIFPNATIKIIR